MPPSSRRVRAARKAAATAAAAHDVSDAETPESIATPSRTSRKRTRASDAVASSARAAMRRKTRDTRAAEREDTEGTEPGEPSDVETEPAFPTEVDVISKLKVSDKPVHAVEDYANDLLEGRENVPGYGKIAGRNWTYIIRDVEVNIGRPEHHEKYGTAEPANGEPQGPTHKSQILIDLGPDRQVSRLHAIISYEAESEQWALIVNGRNGLRVDTQILKRGAKTYLHSGSVIDINGTQMAFITTAVNGSDGPIFADAIIRQTQSSSDDEDGTGGNQHHHQPYHAHPPLPSSGPARRGPQDSNNFSDNYPPSNRVHPHSQNASKNVPTLAPPGTPIRPPQPMPASRSKPSPASNGYARGVMIESTESIDYSADTAKDLKPPHSYAQLIGMAILSTPEQQMTLNNIYKWITANYAFYRFNTGGWQNSIRHNLSLNKAFEKIARRTDEPGKGMKWMISPKEREAFLSQGMKGCRRPNPLPRGPSGGSDPSSPAQFGASAIAHVRLNGSINGVPTKVENTMSPPMHTYPSAYPTATEAYTPDRGSRRPGKPGVSFDENDPDMFYPPSAKSTMNHLTAAANAAGSPPALYINDDGRMGPLDTPFPIRSSQKLAPPSTLQRPSAFMEFSSPAPFWKFGSTPLRPLADISPLKTPFSTFRPIGAIKKDEEDEDDEKHEIRKAESDEGKGAVSPMIAPSSPPRPASADDEVYASPTRTVSRPATSHGRPHSDVGEDKVQQEDGAMDKNEPETQGTVDNETSQSKMDAPVAMASSQPQPHTQLQAPAPPAQVSRSFPQPNGHGYGTAPASTANGYSFSGTTPTDNAHGNMNMNLYGNDVDEEEGIDLARSVHVRKAR
ncbi:transcription factor [Taxawa tesnikishii (nom. ined.)]|nr:transcription factor [Dothideales sp. JES 119]